MNSKAQKLKLPGGGGGGEKKKEKGKRRESNILTFFTLSFLSYKQIYFILFFALELLIFQM